MKKLTLILILFVGLKVSAHQSSTSYINIDILPSTVTKHEEIKIKWDISLKDLNFLLALDTDQDSQITWAEVKSHHGDLAKLLLSHLDLTAATNKNHYGHSHHHHHGHHHGANHHHRHDLGEWIGARCQRVDLEQLIDKHNDGNYSSLMLKYDCKDLLDSLAIDYDLLFDLDPKHKVLVKLNYHGQNHSFVLDKKNQHKKLKLGEIDPLAQFVDFLSRGYMHILGGYDHILFLIALLLPSVLMVENRRIVPIRKLSTSMWGIVKLVTAFTLAHSITVTLAAFELVDFDSRIIEALIALSIAVAGIKNLCWLSLHRYSSWLVAFVFGLIHGFGFAGALRDLGLKAIDLVIPLVSFNFGVELGQLLIVVVFLLVFFPIKKTQFYINWVFRLGSLAIVILSLIWFVQRI